MNEQVEQDVLAALTTLAAGAAHNASMVTAAAAAQRRPKGASYVSYQAVSSGLRVSEGEYVALRLGSPHSLSMVILPRTSKLGRSAGSIHYFEPFRCNAQSQTTQPRPLCWDPSSSAPCPADPLPLPPPPAQAPVTDAAQLAELRLEGLTDRGDEKVRKGDLRCRPPKHYRETLLPKPLPQFRLSTVEDAARAEDLVMLWAYLTGRGEKRFKTKKLDTLRSGVVLKGTGNLGHLFHFFPPSLLLQNPSCVILSSVSSLRPTQRTLCW